MVFEYKEAKYVDKQYSTGSWAFHRCHKRCPVHLDWLVWRSQGHSYNKGH